jgi:hypothetical protein
VKAVRKLGVAVAPGREPLAGDHHPEEQRDRDEQVEGNEAAPVGEQRKGCIRISDGERDRRRLGTA